MASLKLSVPGARRRRRSAALLTIVLGVATVTCVASPAPQQPASPAPAPTAPAGAAYSSYVSTLQSRLLSTDVVAEFYRVQIKDDARRSDHEAFRKDSRDFLAAMQDANNNFAALAPDGPVAPDDSRYCDSARDAGQAITSADLDVAMNLAGVTGPSVNADMKAAATKVAQLRRKFTATVMQGYRHFGHPPADVDRASLALKRKS